jgi:regulator of replication initiation timing
MAFITLVHPNESRDVSGVQLILKCTTFQQNVSLLAIPYLLQSAVSLNGFRDFISLLEDHPIQIKNDNYDDLMLLVNEFGYENLSKQLSIFRESAEFQMRDSTRNIEFGDKIRSLEELSFEHERQIAALQGELFRQSQQIQSILTELFPRLNKVEEMMKEMKGEMTTLRLSSEASRRLEAEIEQLREEMKNQQSKERVIDATEMNSKLDSTIVNDFPSIFTEFKSKQVTLLWRGSRDGFCGRDFHSRCDGHENTLTMILDTNGNIFGGYTRLKWESRERVGNGSNRYKSDESLESWLFTLKNPYNTEPRKFGLASNDKRYAIFCGCSGGPEFGVGHDGFGDIAIRDKCNVSNSSSTSFGRTYINDTNIHDDKLFTGSSHFIVKEIEVFEIMP